MNLYAHQEELILRSPDKHLLAWECGSGKSLTALRLAGDSSTIIVCPKSLREQWEEQTDHRVLTKEQFKKLAQYMSGCECLIIDEAHFFFGLQGARKMSGMLKALLGYIKKHQPRKIYLLTATPYMSSPWNIYAAAKILGRNWDAGLFKETFFSMVNMGMRWPVPVVKKGIEPAIAKMVNSLGNTVKMEDCFDIPEQTFLTEYFDLTKEQKAAIAGLTEEGIARWTKTHQICGGTLKGDGYTEDKEFDSEKMKRVLELAQEHKKLIIVCRYNHEIKVISERIKNRTVIIINGQQKDRHSAVRLAEDNHDCVVLIQASCSEGYELPSFPIMVFYSYDFSLKNYVQVIGRILRANKLKKNVYISLVVRKTIDEDVFKCIQSKKDFDIAIYNK